MYVHTYRNNRYTSIIFTNTTMPTAHDENDDTLTFPPLSLFSTRIMHFLPFIYTHFSLTAKKRLIFFRNVLPEKSESNAK